MIKSLLSNYPAKKNFTGCGIVPHAAIAFYFFASLLLSLFSGSALAETASLPSARSAGKETGLCPVDSRTNLKPSRPPVFSAENIGNTEISADATMSGDDGSITLDGNVVIERHLLRLTADHARYDRQKDILQLSGNVHVNSETLSLNADTGTVNMITTEEPGSKQGKFSNATFFVPNGDMKGRAETITSSESADNNRYSVLNNASITSCNLLDPDWLLSADEIWLDHNDEYGSADDVVLRFKDVPFLYTPYMEFPTSNKRRSGLLFPDFGSSSTRGTELAVPWYWNIAPNQDAVIVPRNMTSRGLELGGEYRYLTESTNGELKGAYLDSDKITDEDRYQVRYLQHSTIAPNLLLDIDLQDISDSNYFNDFTNSLGSTSQTHLYRNAVLNYSLENWQARALVSDIKTIDSTAALSSRPYKRLPQLTFNGETKIATEQLFFTLDSEFVDFTHDDDTKITGDRLTVRPGLRLPLSGTAWFIEPEVKFSHTQYNVGVENSLAASVTDTEINSRDLLISSIDAGLFFERFFDNGYMQTLEPRIYYLYVPYKDQSDIPVFDTRVPEFSVAQLFRDNRFIGGDRIGDANQLTVAVSSRIMNTKTGDEILRASIGQIYYFEDRQVSLNNTIDMSRQSDIIAEFDTRWGRWQSSIDLQWDRVNDELAKENYFLHYKSDARHLANIGYRKHMKNGSLDIEQSDVSFVYALNRKYTAIGRWNYSLKDKQDIDIIGGLAYDSCCWSIQLLAQRRRQNTTASSGIDEYNNAILIQFVLKGMGSLSGNKTRNTLEQSVFGYNDIFQ